MVRSIRWRLQIWYAIVLMAVIVGFAGVLTYQVRTNRLRQVDQQLEAAARYLEATIRSLPPHELDDTGPPDGRRPPAHPRFGNPSPGRRPPPDAPPAGPPPEPGGLARQAEDRQPPPNWAGGDRPRPFDRPRERPRPPIELPPSLLNRPDDEPHDRPYFAAWRAGGSSLASSDEGAPLRRPDLRGLTLGTPAIFRWQSPARREAILAGPRGTMILVGKPIDRELGELRAFAWQTVATGLMVLAVGLIGGWITSRSITRPIATISQTASAISASNLSRRIQTPDVDQELVGLATILNDMFARLEAAFLRQSRFTSDASHELRTPLAVIRSHAELALSKPRTADEYRETLAACLAAASRMAALVDGLLTLARADAGRLDADFKSVDLESVVEEVVDQYRPQAQSAAVSLSTSLDGPAVVRGDLAFLSRIAGNLLSNAIRYTPAGGSVRVSLVADGREARLAIEDTGCGMSPEDQRQVFDRFFRADKARSRALGGNGLGLAICRSLVEAHGGTITFHSVLDRGTRFEVRLPLAVARAVIESQPSLPSPELSGPVRDRTS